MAIILTSSIVGEIRNKVGGVVFSRSRSGATVRACVKPTASHTAAISQQRAHHSIKAAFWRDGLTNAQRLVWNTAAETVQWTNHLGQEYTPTGFHLFIRQAQGRLDAPAGFPVAPVYPLKMPPPALVLTWNEADDRIYVNTPTNFLPPANGYFMRWYSPENPKTHYHVAGRWHYAGIWTFTQGVPFQQLIRIADWKTRPTRFYLRLRACLQRYTQSDPITLGISLPPEP